MFFDRRGKGRREFGGGGHEKKLRKISTTQELSKV